MLNRPIPGAASALSALAGPSAAAQLELAQLAELGREVLHATGAANPARALATVQRRLRPAAPTTPAAPRPRAVDAFAALEQRAAESGPGVTPEIRARAEANQAGQTLEAYARAAGLDLVRLLAEP